MMETLAIIAYRQPITRPEIEQLRGVDSGAVLETLTERRLVKIAGPQGSPRTSNHVRHHRRVPANLRAEGFGGLPDLSELREVEQQIENAEQERLAEQGEEGVPEQLDLMPTQSSPEPAPEQLDLAPAEASPEDPRSTGQIIEPQEEPPRDEPESGQSKKTEPRP